MISLAPSYWGPQADNVSFETRAMPISFALEQVDSAAGFLHHSAELVDKVYGGVASADPTTTLAITQRGLRGVVGVLALDPYIRLKAVQTITD